VDRQEADGLQHGSEAESLFEVAGPVSMISLTMPLAELEFMELDEFLMSDGNCQEMGRYHSG
jgi:hypothetical protein